MALIWLALTALASDPGLHRAHTANPGEVSFGVFSPLVIGVAEQTDVTVANSVLLGAPHLRLTRGLHHKDGLDIAVTSALGVPTLGLMAIRGTVLSTDPTQSLGPAVTGSVGVLTDITAGPLTGHMGLEGRAGWTGAGWGLTSPGWFWLDPMLAPLTEGPVLDWRVAVDWRPHDRITLSADRVLHAGGIGPDWHTRFFGRWQASELLGLGAGIAAAHEAFEERRDNQWTPVLDLRFGWGG